MVPTLTTLRDAEVPLPIECRECGHRADIPYATLARPGTEMWGIITVVRRRLRCQSCGGGNPFFVIPRTPVDAAALVGRPLPAEVRVDPTADYHAGRGFLSVGRTHA